MNRGTRIGYFAAQEDHYTPNELLEFAVLAEQSGFDDIWTSDHFHPWVHSGSNCGFAWTWLAVAADRTKRVNLGTAVTAPILRYNPAIVAQAFASLGSMFPGRVFLSVATGEALNEVPVGGRWPSFRERATRLEEAVRVIKALWTGDFVDFQGKYFTLRKATLYTKPQPPIRLNIAANGPTVAEIAGKYGDGFLTVPLPVEHYQNILFPAYERGAKSAGRDPQSVEKLVEMMVSFDEDYERALGSCRRWAPTVLGAVFKYAIFDPSEMESYGALIGEEGIKTQFAIATSPEQIIKEIEKYQRLGFTNIHIQSCSPDERNYIRTVGKDVLPHVRVRG